MEITMTGTIIHYAAYLIARPPQKRFWAVSFSITDRDVHPDRAKPRTCSPCHPDRAKRAEGSAASVRPSSKEEWKTAHANKNAFATFSIPLSLPERQHPERAVPLPSRQRRPLSS